MKDHSFCIERFKSDRGAFSGRKIDKRLYYVVILLAQKRILIGGLNGI